MGQCDVPVGRACVLQPSFEVVPYEPTTTIGLQLHPAAPREQAIPRYRDRYPDSSSRLSSSCRSFAVPTLGAMKWDNVQKVRFIIINLITSRDEKQLLAGEYERQTADLVLQEPTELPTLALG